ncbi:hypothetical protein ACFQ8T_04390 [Isoptericola sp. NPDC056618]|uniref:hypothetical protein n=1 Tax=Isoptericola sp. NPDC056618 TaxID=3345878 RepID=UPI0036CB962B
MRPVSWSAARPLHRVRTVLGVVLVIAAVAFAVYMLLARHDSPAALPTDTTTRPGSTASADVPPSPAPTSSELAPIATTTDEVIFVTEVAHALFEWDTTGPYTLADHKGRLLAVADPSGVDSPGLVADLDGYLPSKQAWDFLADYETRQWIAIADVVVPDQWADAVAGAGDDVAPGMTALTVTGVRHRAGVWESSPASDAFDVAFTAVVACEPAFPRCYLLRLSRLDEPLR